VVKHYPVDSGCSLQMNCNPPELSYQVGLSSSCSEDVDGVWTCSCYSSQTATTQYYKLTGVEDTSQACDLGLPICAQGSGLVWTSPVCASASNDVGNSSCVAGETCYEYAQLNDRVQAEISTERQASCTDRGYDSDCWCLDTEYRAAPVSGTTIDSACSVSLEVCGRDVDPALLESACEAPSQYQDSTSCSSSTVCGAKLPQLGSDSVYALLNPYQKYSSCNSSGNGSADDYWNCSCSGTSISRSLAIKLDDTGPSAACAVADALCQPDVTFVPAGTPSCEVTGVGSSGGAACNATQVCFQPGMFGATPLAVGAQIYTYCYQLTGGDWSCSCESGGSNTSSTFAASGSGALAVCTSAAADCATQAVYAEDAYGYPAFTFSIPAVTDAGAGG
jgi:hypothetical protein